jgi:hypothetical protein
MTNKILVIYHARCLDGLAAASITRAALGVDRVELYPASYQTPPPDMKDRIVYIVDFSWEPAILLPAAVEAEQVVMMDHHDTACAAWKDVELPEHFRVIFNQHRSGAGIAWDFFNPGSPMPEIFKALQDYDLHTWKIDGSREIASCLGSIGVLDNQDIDTFEHWIKNVPRAEMVARGEIVIELNRNHIDGMISRNWNLISFEGFIVPVANIPSQFATAAGTILSEGYPFSITYEDQLTTGKRKFDLRCPKESTVHCGEIAKLYGGGGHKGAAGFYLPIPAADKLLFKGKAGVTDLDEYTTALDVLANIAEANVDVDATLQEHVKEFVKDEFINDYANVVTTLKSTFAGTAADPVARIFMAIGRIAFPSYFNEIANKVKKNLTT